MSMSMIVYFMTSNFMPRVDNNIKPRPIELLVS